MHEILTGNAQAKMDQLTQRLRQLLTTLMSRKGVRHALMAVERGDGSFRWIGAEGDANQNGLPMQTDTPFFLASIDKLYTATIIMKLREQGHLSLDEPMVAYLPRTRLDGLHRFRGKDVTHSITVHHLLSHTTGLPDWLEDAPRGGRSLVELLVEDGDRATNLDDILRLVRDDLIPHFPPQPLKDSHPKVRYSDTNFILLRAIVEAITGQPFHQVLEELLLRPLGLHHTYLPGHSRPIAATPGPAMLWFNSRPLEIPLMMRSFCGIYSSAEDSLKFLRAWIWGRVFDDPSTPALMQRQWRRFGFPLDRAALRLPTWPIEYGLGIMRFQDPVLHLFGRLPRPFRLSYPAPPVVGHTGSTGSWLFYCAELDLFLAGTVDQATAGALPFRLVPRILEAVHRASRQG